MTSKQDGAIPPSDGNQSNKDEIQDTEDKQHSLPRSSNTEPEASELVGFFPGVDDIVNAVISPISDLISPITSEVDKIVRDIDNIGKQINGVSEFASIQLDSISKISRGDFDIAENAFETAKQLNLGDLRGKGSISGPIEILRNSPIQNMRGLGEELNGAFPKEKMQSVDLVKLRRGVSYVLDIVEMSLETADKHIEHDELSKKIYDIAAKVTRVSRTAANTVSNFLVDNVGSNHPVIKWLEFPFDINGHLDNLIETCTAIKDVIAKLKDSSIIQNVRRVLLTVLGIVPRLGAVITKLFDKIANAFPMNVKLGGSFGAAVANFEPSADPVSLTKMLAGAVNYAVDLIVEAAGSLKDFVENYIREKPKIDAESLLIDKIADAVVAKLRHEQNLLPGLT